MMEDQRGRLSVLDGGPAPLERRNSIGGGGDKWVCPNDRHLALRAKLRMGWSTGQATSSSKQDSLSNEETKAILDVIKRAEQLEATEHQRIGRLVGRVNAMKDGARGNGVSSCILCGDTLPLLRAATVCRDCKKGVCSKCGHDVTSAHEKVWLCKICSETREMWKRSGAWFYRGLPQGLSKLGMERSGAHGSSPSISQQNKPIKGLPRRAHSLLNADFSSLLGYGGGDGHDTDSSEEDCLRRQRLQEKRNTDPFRSHSVSPAASTTSVNAPVSNTRARTVSAGDNNQRSPPPNPTQPAGFGDIFLGSNSSTGPPSDNAASEWVHINGGGGEHQLDSLQSMSSLERRRGSTGSSTGQNPSIDSSSMIGNSRQDHLQGQYPERSPSPFMRTVRDSTISPSSLEDRTIRQRPEDCLNDHSQEPLPQSPFNRASSPPQDPSPKSQAACGFLPPSNGSLDDSVVSRRQGPDHAPLGSTYSRDSKDSFESSVYASSVDEVFEGGGTGQYQRGQSDAWSVSTAEQLSMSFDNKHQPENNRDRCNSVASSVCSSVSNNSAQKSTAGGAAAKNKQSKADIYLGSLEFTLFYDSHHQSLHCTLHHAQDLKSASSSAGGLADPYVKIHLLPGASKSNKLRSRTVNKTLSPEFNETLTYHGISEDDMGKKTLRMMVMDEDRFGRHFLGEARVSLKKVKAHESRRLRVQLQNKMSKSDDGPAEDSSLGKILLSLRYTSVRNCLTVGIVRCAHLPSRDANGFSDPYVKVQLKPDKQKRKLKTAVKWKNLNPEFHEEFNFEVQRNELPKKQLDVRVYDKDVGRTDDFIGGLVLSHDSRGPELRHWYDVIQYPDKRHDRWHSLRPMHSC